MVKSKANLIIIYTTTGFVTLVNASAVASSRAKV